MRGLFCITICSLILGACNYKESKLSVPRPSGAENTPSKTLLSAEFVKSYSLSTCLDCHSGRSKPNLAVASGIEDNIDSILMEVALDSMPPSKSGYPPLTDCEKAVLNRWSELGMPELSNETLDSLPECAPSAPPEKP